MTTCAHLASVIVCTIPLGSFWSHSCLHCCQSLIQCWSMLVFHFGMLNPDSSSCLFCHVLSILIHGVTCFCPVLTPIKQLSTLPFLAISVMLSSTPELISRLGERPIALADLPNWLAVLWPNHSVRTYNTVTNIDGTYGHNIGGPKEQPVPSFSVIHVRNTFKLSWHKNMHFLKVVLSWISWAEERLSCYSKVILILCCWHQVWVPKKNFNAHTATRWTANASSMTLSLQYANSKGTSGLYRMRERHADRRSGTLVEGKTGSSKWKQAASKIGRGSRN